MKEVWDMENTPTFDCPEEYKGKLFLTASDMQAIFQLGENKTYEYLKEAPFRVIKVGNQIRVLSTIHNNSYVLKCYYMSNYDEH